MVVPSFSSLRHEARKINESSHDPAVSKLAEIVEQLCTVCGDLEQKTKAAHDEANRAKRLAKKD
jgi:outer membrane murein-binding lipoprotein Lpp